MSAEQYLVKIDAECSKIEYLNQLEKKTGVRKAYIAIALGAVLIGLMFVNVVAGLIANLVGFIYPAYASFKALETPDDRDDKLWLSYWIVFGFFNCLEFFADLLLFWLPFYYFLKLIFLIYLFAPQTKGAAVIYEKFLGPVLRQYQGKIDQEVNEIKDKVTKTGRDIMNSKNVKNVANQVANDVTKEVVNQALNQDKKEVFFRPNAGHRGRPRARPQAAKARQRRYTFRPLIVL